MAGSRGFVFICCVFLLVMIIAGEDHLPQNKQRACTYEVTIQTTCTKGAQTSSRVSLRFGDKKSNDILVHHLNTKHIKQLDPLQPQVLDDIPRKPFQACITDQFQVKSQCVESPICYLYLKLTGSDDWRPGFAQVRVLEESEFVGEVGVGGESTPLPHNRLSSGYFYFRRYLPRHVWHGHDLCDKEVTPFGVEHKRKVF